MNKKSLLKKCSPNFVLFFEWAEEYMRKHNKKIIVVDAKKIQFDGGWCGGWCDGDEIAIAGRSALFEETFVHEFAHMMQAIEKSPIWKKEFKFWDDLEKDNVTSLSWPRVLEIIELERDCEKRAIALSKKWDLFDNKIYAQRANVYLYFYQYIFMRGKWMDSTSLYASSYLSDSMPEQIVSMKKLSQIDIDLMQIYEKQIGKGKKNKK